LKRVPTLPCVG